MPLKQVSYAHARITANQCVQETFIYDVKVTHYV